MRSGKTAGSGSQQALEAKVRNSLTGFRFRSHVQQRGSGNTFWFGAVSLIRTNCGVMYATARKIHRCLTWFMWRVLAGQWKCALRKQRVTLASTITRSGRAGIVISLWQCAPMHFYLSLKRIYKIQEPCHFSQLIMNRAEV